MSAGNSGVGWRDPCRGSRARGDASSTRTEEEEQRRVREEASSCSQRTQTVHTFTLTPSFSGRRPEPIAVEFVLCTFAGGCIHTYP